MGFYSLKRSVSSRGLSSDSLGNNADVLVNNFRKQFLISELE